ncbi:MAG: LysR family transcriptional regulator [Eubacterium sp.]|nr:LysR family transcriptional regulator [Eubacterium sp.]
MDIRVLRYFLAVAREENITRASESLHIAQSSLSKQLIELEQELGKQLLVRGKRKITLTEEGVLLRKRADEIVDLLEKTERDIRLDSETVRGEISIGGGPSNSIIQKAAQLREKYPEVQFRFLFGDAVDITERLDHGSLDFAVLIDPVDTMKYDCISLKESSQWGVLMKADSPMAAHSVIHSDELAQIPLIIHQRAGLQRDLARWASREIDFLNIAGTFNIIHGSPARFVESGLGNVLIMNNLVDITPGQNLCFRPLAPALKTSYSLVWKRYPVFHKAAEVFLALMKKM